jgi:hypothetical protein
MNQQVGKNLKATLKIRGSPFIKLSLLRQMEGPPTTNNRLGYQTAH